MHTDVLTNCLISLGLSRNSTPQTISKLDEQEEQHHDDDEVSRTKFIQDGPDSERSDSGDNNETESKPRRKSHLSLNLSQFFVTQIIVWLMRIQHFLKFMMLLIISATAECSFSPLKVPIRDIFFFISVESALSVDTKKRKQR